jgi:hypothetical protein
MSSLINTEGAYFCAVKEEQEGFEDIEGQGRVLNPQKINLKLSCLNSTLD